MVGESIPSYCIWSIEYTNIRYQQITSIKKSQQQLQVISDEQFHKADFKM